MGAYSFRSALVRTWPLLPYGTSPPSMEDMNLLGGTVSVIFFSSGGGVLGFGGSSLGLSALDSAKMKKMR